MQEMNPAMQLAYDYLENTNTVVFLTGKVGTPIKDKAAKAHHLVNEPN